MCMYMHMSTLALYVYIYYVYVYIIHGNRMRCFIVRCLSMCQVVSSSCPFFVPKERHASRQREILRRAMAAWHAATRLYGAPRQHRHGGSGISPASCATEESGTRKTGRGAALWKRLAHSDRSETREQNKVILYIYI